MNRWTVKLTYRSRKTGAIDTIRREYDAATADRAMRLALTAHQQTGWEIERAEIDQRCPACGGSRNVRLARPGYPGVCGHAFHAQE